MRLAHGLCVAFFILCAVGVGMASSAFATPEPPFNPQFPSAQFPYAARSNGCGSSSTLAKGRIQLRPEWVRDSWGSVSFRAACDRHDACYFIGGSQEDCDLEFYHGMNNACEQTLTFEKPWLSTTLPGCHLIAASYYNAVRALGEESFEQARREQAAYNAWLQEIGFQPTPE